MTTIVYAFRLPLSSCRSAWRRLKNYYTPRQWAFLAIALPVIAVAGWEFSELWAHGIYWLTDHRIPDHTWRWSFS